MLAGGLDLTHLLSLRIALGGAIWAIFMPLSVSLVFSHEVNTQSQLLESSADAASVGEEISQASLSFACRFIDIPLIFHSHNRRIITSFSALLATFHH
jgi:hypothetical protein